MEQEKLEKLARKGPSSGEQASSTTSSAASDVKAADGPTESVVLPCNWDWPSRIMFFCSCFDC